jgi:hypothetical protein
MEKTQKICPQWHTSLPEGQQSHSFLEVRRSNEEGNPAEVTGDALLLILRLGNPLKIKTHRWRVFSTRHRKSKTNEVQK